MTILLIIGAIVCFIIAVYLWYSVMFTEKEKEKK